MPHKSGAAKSAKVVCRSCGEGHEPIREFRAEDGGYVCSWRCLGRYIYTALYGQPCPPEVLENINENQYWHSYRVAMSETQT